jgi:hypothetical protein
MFFSLILEAVFYMEYSLLLYMLLYPKNFVYIGFNFNYL